MWIKRHTSSHGFKRNEKETVDREGATCLLPILCSPSMFFVPLQSMGTTHQLPQQELPRTSDGNRTHNLQAAFPGPFAPPMYPPSISKKMSIRDSIRGIVLQPRAKQRWPSKQVRDATRNYPLPSC